MLVLTLMLILDVNGAIENNAFFSSVNTSTNATVNADARCEHSFNILLSSKVHSHWDKEKTKAKIFFDVWNFSLISFAFVSF